MGATIPFPEPPPGNTQESQPEQEAGSGLREEKNQRQEALEGTAKSVDGGVAELHQNRRRGGVELGLVLFGELQVDGGELDAMLQRFLFGLYLLDFAAHAGEFLFDFQYIFDLTRTGTKNILKPPFGFAGIFQAREQVGVLLRNFFPVLRFIFEATERFRFA